MKEKRLTNKLSKFVIYEGDNNHENDNRNLFSIFKLNFCNPYSAYENYAEREQFRKPNYKTMIGRSNSKEVKENRNSIPEKIELNGMSHL